MLTSSTFHTRTMAILASTFTVGALAGCASDGPDETPSAGMQPTAESPVAVTTVTEMETTVETHTAPAGGNPGGGNSSDNAGDGNEAPGGGAGRNEPAPGGGDPASNFQEEISAQYQNGMGVGSTLTIDGTPTEVCVYGDGYGLNTISAGPNTSCAFAVTLFNNASRGLNPTQDNIRTTMPKELMVHSPTTGEDYSMSCSNDERRLVTCRGGDNAVVYMY